MIEAIISVLALAVAVFAGLWATSTSSRVRAEKAAETTNKSNAILKTKYDLQVERNKVLRDELKAKIRKDLETRSPGDVLDDFINARGVYKDKN